MQTSGGSPRTLAMVALGVGLLSTAYLAPNPELQAQPLTSCPNCRVVFAHVGVLGSEKDPVAADDFGPLPFRLSDGQTMLRSSDRMQLVIYDRAGRFKNTIGRKGGGPGEFRNIAATAIGKADTLYVFQPGGAISVFRANGKYVGNIYADIQVPFSLMQLAGGQFVASMVTDPNGQTFATLSSNGKLLSKFGGGRHPAECHVCHTYMLAPGKQAGTFLAIGWGGYRVETWSTAGKLEREVAIASTSFPADSRAPRIAGLPPLARVISLAMDAKGRLWIGGSAPNANWVEKTSGGHVGGGGILRPGTAAAAPTPDQYDAIVDVVDPATGALLGTGRIPGARLLAVSDGIAYTQSEDADGIPQIHVWALTVVASKAGQDSQTAKKPNQ